MTDKKSRWAGIKDARSPSGGVWIEPGIYDLEIKETKYVEGFKGESFVAEMDVLVSSNPDRKVGTRVSWVSNLKHPSALGNIKGFVARALNTKEEDVTEEVMDAVCDGDNRLKGTVLHCIAMHIPTQKGGVFTRCTWDYLRGGPGAPSEQQSA